MTGVVVEEVLFLDPDATQVEWSSLEHIATFEAIDTWVLLSRLSNLSDVTPIAASETKIGRHVLNKIYGDESWSAYTGNGRQFNLFDMDEREQGVEGFLNIYKAKLSDLFGMKDFFKSPVR